MLSDFGKSNDILGFNDLQDITGYKSSSQVAASLRNSGVKFLLGKSGRPYTTLGAIELAMGATQVQKQLEEDTDLKDFII